MKSLRNFLIAMPLVSALLFAQSGQPAGPYTGTLVNANCGQASALMNPTSGSYADRTSDQQTSATKKVTQSSIDAAKKSVLRHCQPTVSTKSFALLTSEGAFLKLDDAGNRQVLSQMMGTGTGKKTALPRNTHATVTGSVQGDTLKVQSISKN
jgi:hypothetical protein